MLRKVAKEQWIKTSFWMPENAAEELKKEASNVSEVEPEKVEKPKMMCPYSRPKAEVSAEGSACLDAE